MNVSTQLANYLLNEAYMGMGLKDDDYDQCNPDDMTEIEVVNGLQKYLSDAFLDSMNAHTDKFIPSKVKGVRVTALDDTSYYGAVVSVKNNPNNTHMFSNVSISALVLAKYEKSASNRSKLIPRTVSAFTGDIICGIIIKQGLKLSHISFAINRTDLQEETHLLKIKKVFSDLILHAMDFAYGNIEFTRLVAVAAVTLDNASELFNPKYKLLGISQG